MLPILKKILIALVLVALFAGIYIFMNSGTEDVEDTTITEMDITARTNQILSDTKKVDSYALDTSIFDDSRFSTLEDYHIEIPDVATGRLNPFEIVN